MPIPTISAEQYATERAICDKAAAYARAAMAARGPRCNYLTADEAKHPDYAACDNDMRGRVEQYELLHDTPETLVAYLGRPDRQACNYETGQPWPVTVWTGREIGRAFVRSKWRVRSFIGSHMHQFEARINGRVFTGRSFGEGMAIVLRETAASKRARNAA